MTKDTPRIRIKIVNQRWGRYVLVDGNGEIWTGVGWSGRRADAMVYSDPKLASEAAEVLARWLREEE